MSCWITSFDLKFDMTGTVQLMPGQLDMGARTIVCVQPCVLNARPANGLLQAFAASFARSRGRAQPEPPELTELNVTGSPFN